MQEELFFGAWLRKQRRALDLTRRAFANQVGCAEVTLRHIEVGILKPSRELANILLEQLGIPELDRAQWISFARGQSGFPSQLPFPSNKPPTNLPAPLTTFVGREKEQLDVIQLLTKRRLVTLTGSGGVGKTRLAIKVTEQVLGNHPDGVWLVELAPILDPLLVPRIAAITIGLRDEPQRPVIDMLCDYLQNKKMLLVLDNCEHLVDACAHFIFKLLNHCSYLNILATSREPLGVTGEAIYRVPSLEIPDIQQLPDNWREFESIKLFEERAQLVQYDFSVIMENALSVAHICHRLDGIPLAIELAAAKVGILSTEQIAKQLDESINLLVAEGRTVLSRQRTLHASIDWSWDLLTVSEQRLMRQVSVFIGGWTLKAAQSVCDGDVLYLINSLVTKSLIEMHQGREDHVRYRFHEIIRQFASMRLMEAAESEALRYKHFAYFLDLAETAAPKLTQAEQIEWLSLLESDHDNFRFALEWALDKESAELALRLCAALGRFWAIRGYWLEGSKWLAGALEKVINDQEETERTAHVKALCQDAELAQHLDNLERMKTSSELALKLALEGSNRHNIAVASFYVGFALFRLGNLNEARPYLEESLNEFRELNDPYWEACTYMWLGSIQFHQGELNPVEHSTQTLELARKAGERLNLADALITYSYMLKRYERREEARKHLEEALEVSEEINSNTYSGTFAFAQFALAEIEWLDGNLQQSKALYQKSHTRFHLMGEKQISSNCMEYLGILSIEEGNLTLAQTALEQSLSTARDLEAKFFIARRLALLSILFYLQGKNLKSKQILKESISVAKDLSPHLMASVLQSLLISPHFQMPENSVLLLGVIGRFQKEFDVPLDSLFKRYYVHADAQARKFLGTAGLDAALAKTQKISLEKALDLAFKTVEKL